MRGSRGELGVRPPPPPPEKSQNIGFPSNIGPDPLKVTKLPSQHSMLDHHQNADDGPVIMVYGSSLPLQQLNKPPKNPR